MARGGAVRPGGKGDASGGAHVGNPFPRGTSHRTVKYRIRFIQVIGELGGW